MAPSSRLIAGWRGGFAHLARLLPLPASTSPVLAASLIPALKTLRKWSDRAFHWREAWRAGILGSRPKRILFSPWPEIEASLRQGFRRSAHTVTFAPIPPGGGGFDLVVPCSIEALMDAAADEALRRRNPLRLPDPSVIRLCDDKAALNARLCELGFRAHIPAAAQPGDYPYLLKLRRDACALNTFLIAGAEDEAAHAERLSAPDYLRQRCVRGEVEYTTHLLMADGRLRRHLTVSFWMERDCAIKGRDSVRLHRRCPARRADLVLFESMLAAIGFEGLCCVNYKLSEGVPMLFEINPRLGFSLGPFFSTFLRSLEWHRAA